MCGIFGIIPQRDARLNISQTIKLFEKVAVLSESRGKESSGCTILNNNTKEINSIKGPVAVSELLKSEEYQKFKAQLFSKSNIIPDFMMMGHSRLVTNGSQLKDFNNQPTYKDGLVGIHNGIITNEDELWNSYSDLTKDFEIDTEVMLSILRYNIDTIKNLTVAAIKTFSAIQGTVSTIILFKDFSKVLFFTNNGSLYLLRDKLSKILLFASEHYILQSLILKTSVAKNFSDLQIRQVRANSGIIFNLQTYELDEFLLSQGISSVDSCKSLPDINYEINTYSIQCDIKKITDSLTNATCNYNKQEAKLLEYNFESISRLKRCSKCLLPETFPFIEFDATGICNICNNYKLKNQPKPVELLFNLVNPYRKNGKPDCIVPFSGGRDSSYTVHYVKNILHLNPITYTYDWGMVTDLARRNIARICGKLGIENIIVSADIRKKREYIRKNILAWLKKPELGMVPLFMAGDKYFYYYTQKIKEQTGIDLNIWGINNLENTDFKVGFCGVKLNFDKKTNYSLELFEKMKLFYFVGQNLLKNYSYLNSSLLDSLGSFISRYFYPQKDYYHLFDFISWDEKEIESVIINEYDWETSPDTKSTWRIGDGTASFYNYIYYTIAGFSEHETFRSNQIREGLLTRDEAWDIVMDENIPRIESIKWYLDIIGMDFETTIKAINNIPKLYVSS